MARYRIVCVNKNYEGDIIQVGIEDLGVQRVDAVINDMIRNGTQYYTTVPSGSAADVLYKPKSNGVGYYLTTSPDGIQPNNLDFLPECHY